MVHAQVLESLTILENLLFLSAAEYLCPNRITVIKILYIPAEKFPFLVGESDE